MKYLLIATALSLGFSGTCLAAQMPASHAKTHIAEASTVKPQFPFARQSKGLSCHVVGQKDVCKPV
jgi:hypothetical protein